MKKGPHLVLYDSSNSKRLMSLDFGTIRPGTSSWETVVWLWNKKEFSDAPVATDVRVCAMSGNSWAEEIISEGYLKVKSNGVQDPDGKGIIDDAETEFSSIGGSLTDSDDYHSIGDIPSNCARRLIFRVDLPVSFSSEGEPNVIVQAGNMSEDVKWLYAAE